VSGSREAVCEVVCCTEVRPGLSWKKMRWFDNRLYHVNGVSRLTTLHMCVRIIVHNRHTQLPGWAGAFLLDFMVQGKITEADTLTMWMGATPSATHLHHPPIFYAGYPSGRYTPNLPWLGTCTRLVGWCLVSLFSTKYSYIRDEEHASNMLACIPSGLVHTKNSSYDIPSYIYSRRSS